MYSVLGSICYVLGVCPTDVQRRYSSHFILITTDRLPTTSHAIYPFIRRTRGSLYQSHLRQSYRILYVQKYIIPDTQLCKSANPPPMPLPSIITALKTLTLSLTIRSRPLLQLPRWSVYPHLVRRVHHRRECRKRLISGGDLR